MVQKCLTRASPDEHIVPIILRTFGYHVDPSSTIVSDMDEDVEDGGARTICVICHDFTRTMEMIHTRGWSEVIIVGTIAGHLFNGGGTHSGHHGLESVTFLLPWVTTAGPNWLRDYPNLQHVSFKGMSSLTTIDDHWMCDCIRLRNPSFVGLSKLTTVGNYWLAGCSHLQNPQFTGLSTLVAVGSGWMWNCVNLEHPSFTTLSHLVEVGDAWMSRCSHLRNPHFTGLTSLFEVGHEWLSRCSHLENPDFGGLASLAKVGRHWMHACNNLQSPNFAGVGRHWVPHIGTLQHAGEEEDVMDGGGGWMDGFMRQIMTEEEMEQLRYVTLFEPPSSM
jgi:hypothetical protein